MVLNILTASQGGACAVIHTECCAFIPDESFIVTHLMTHMKNHIATLNDPFPSLGEILRKWFGLRGSWLKPLLNDIVTYTVNLITVCVTHKAIIFCLSHYASPTPPKNDI